jgi:putative hemolysin
MPAPALSPYPWTDVAIIVALIALNGVFAMSELAIVSSRKPRLEAMARKGAGGARVALDLSADPGKLLSTAQIGITLIGILAGAYSGASLGGPTGERLELLGVGHDTAGDLGFGLVIVVTTFVSLIIGELVPKQLALKHPEAIACRVAYPMDLLSRIAGPFVWLLDGTGRALIRLLGLKESSDAMVTDEEITGAMLLLLERTKSVVEPAGAASLAPIMRPVREPRWATDLTGRPGATAVVLGGGNVDPLLLGKCIEHGLGAMGRYLRLRFVMPDRPGSLARVTDELATMRLNVLDVEHHRSGMQLPLAAGLRYTCQLI